MAGRLEGEVALITGGASGMGRGVEEQKLHRAEPENVPDTLGLPGQGPLQGGIDHGVDLAQAP